MATIQDSLLTILKLQGVGEYVAGMGSAATATSNLAKTTAAMQKSIAGVTLPLLSLGAVVGFSIKAFADDEQQIQRTANVLKNMGSSLPITELQRFSEELAKNTSVDDEAIVALGGLLTQFGLTGDQVKSSLRPIIDASVDTGKSLDEIGEAIGRAVRTGQGRGLVSLGVVFKSTGNQAKDLKSIIDQLDFRHIGAGAAELGTVTGSIKDLKEALSDLASTIVHDLAPSLISLLHGLKSIADFFSEHQDLFLTLAGAAIGARFGGLQGALAGGVAGHILAQELERRRGTANAAAGALGQTGDPTTHRLLGKIEENTDPNKQADALAREVLGGPGTVAAGAANWRDFNMAMGV